MPVERWSPAQVAALARDASSLTGARTVSRPERWAGAGRSADLLWGLCRGSGAHPYQVCVDLTGPAYRCSCPSRKVPCKHALGLLMMWSTGGAVPQADPPAFAAEWQATRAARTAAAPRPARPPDPAAAAKRLRRREDRVAGGLAELSRWLDDQVQQGLAGAERAGWR
ncbi:MAG TPA: SWIM zinc finger family protein, partial [Actinoplanes sp.]|nr:SWIM zinc finger family protein [Actinoplanes sp.]